MPCREEDLFWSELGCGPADPEDFDVEEEFAVALSLETF